VTRLERHIPSNADWIRSAIWWGIVPRWVSKVRVKLMDFIEHTRAFFT
jgi:hypothetical protein